MLSLRTRKTLYLCAVVPAGLLWIPVALVGTVIVVGALGLLCIGSLWRCIATLPIQSRPARVYHSAAIALGIVLMVGFIAISTHQGASYGPLLASGSVLIIVGALVLLEMR